MILIYLILVYHYVAVIILLFLFLQILSMDGALYTRQFEVSACGSRIIQIPYIVLRGDDGMWYHVNSLYNMLTILAPIATKRMLLSALKNVALPPPKKSTCNAPPMVRRRLYRSGWIKPNAKLARLVRADAAAIAFQTLGIHDYVVAQIREDTKATELQDQSKEESEQCQSPSEAIQMHGSRTTTPTSNSEDIDSIDLRTKDDTQIIEVG